MQTSKAQQKQQKRINRHVRIRARVVGTSETPRLAVFKSNRYLYAQLIDDASGRTLAQANSRGSDATQREQAKTVGKAVADAAKAQKISRVVFDRGGFTYTGIIKDLADAARAGGLTF